MSIISLPTLLVIGQSASAKASSASRPKFGKDHLVLADWPIGAATFQQRTGAKGDQHDFAEFVIDRPDGTRQKVTLESPSRVGLPAAGDHDTLVALLLLAKRDEFDSDIVRFVPWQLLQVLGWPLNQKSQRRLQASLKRLKAVTATYLNIWYSRGTRSVESCLITGILAEAQLVFRKGRRTTGAVPESYIQWTRTMHASLEEGSVVDLDLDLYFGCKRPGTKHLLRHLNKVWFAGSKPKPYSRDLKDLACGHLGMTDCKDLKRNFHHLIAELEECGYLQPSDPNVRYQKIRPGVWRVNLEMHPNWIRGKRQPAGKADKVVKPSNPADAAATELVSHYHRHRFGKPGRAPRPHEIRQAKILLKEHEAATLLSLVPSIARTVEHQFRGQDLYFGSAAPYFVAAAGQREKQQRIRDGQANNDANTVDAEAATNEQKRQRWLRREQLIRQWNSLAFDERQKYLQCAVQNARSDFDRRRLSRSQLENDPPREALEEMDRDRPASVLAPAMDATLPLPPVTEAATEVPAAGGRPGNGSAMRQDASKRGLRSRC